MGCHGRFVSGFLQRKLDAAGYHYKVNNRGTSGLPPRTPWRICNRLCSFTCDRGGGVWRKRWPPGSPLSETRRNLDQVLTTLEAAHIKVLLAGITLPPNYGPDYIREFEKVFHELAAQHHVAFVPMIYIGLVHQQGVIQADGIHPTAKGSNIIADTLMVELKPMMKK